MLQYLSTKGARECLDALLAPEMAYCTGAWRLPYMQSVADGKFWRTVPTEAPSGCLGRFWRKIRHKQVDKRLYGTVCTSRAHGKSY